jgi:hypothetical protein
MKKLDKRTILELKLLAVSKKLNKPLLEVAKVCAEKIRKIKSETKQK